MRDLPVLGLMAAILVAGCASGARLPPQTERAIESYYAAHASEEKLWGVSELHSTI